MQATRFLLAILDGWGFGQNPDADAIAKANTPCFDHLWERYPHATLITYGEEVGLPEGQMGNSEVGHLNIGAGRVVYQELARINKAVREGTLAHNPALAEIIAFAKSHRRPLHLMGLYSDGGVHAHVNHCKALVEIAEAQGVSEIYIHAFTDGRDCDPKSGYGFIEDLLRFLEGKRTKLASVIGRYYAMDRDKRWERTRLAYDLLVQGKGIQASDILGAIRERYAQGETDEFLQPICVGGQNGLIKDGDAVLCFNFRTDRPRQITMALTQQDFPEFGMHKLNLRYATMTNYDETFVGVETLFKNDNLQNTIGEVLARAGKTQVRIAETEKYPHVTFFFSGGREKAFPGERRILIPSPKVATYDLQPEMSARGIADAIVQDMQINKPDFVCLNFANADMVGHTGVFQAAIKAAETVDECLDKVIATALSLGYEALVIADHGNSDFMVNEDGSPNTAHTKNLVPCIFVANHVEGITIRNGKLADIAPTILCRLGIEVPEEMDGEILTGAAGIPPASV
ncbi:MAG: hypothetical protein RL386_1607 [Bacteroidota bacterium]|jgi:2,3-bisphosphoglycerate-independent phosphoglycerate mutase